MTNPQLEDGYTRIANEIMEALSKIRIPGEAMQILLVILRKTYGFNKKEDAISLSQFHLATGIKKPSIIRAIKLLESMKLIYKKANDKIASYRFNKNLASWKPLAKKITVSEKVNQRLPKSKSAFTKKLPTKDNITKDNITKDKKQHLDFVFLADDEFKKLKKKWPCTYQKKIKSLNDYGHIKPKKFKEYQDHYRVILNWNEDAPVEHERNETAEKKNKPVIKSPETRAIAKKILALGKCLGAENTPEKRQAARENLKKLNAEMTEASTKEKVRMEREGEGVS